MLHSFSRTIKPSMDNTMNSNKLEKKKIIAMIFHGPISKHPAASSENRKLQGNATIIAQVFCLSMKYPNRHSKMTV